MEDLKKIDSVMMLSLVGVACTAFYIRKRKINQWLQIASKAD